MEERWTIEGIKEFAKFWEGDLGKKILADFNDFKVQQINQALLAPTKLEKPNEQIAFCMGRVSGIQVLLDYINHNVEAVKKMNEEEGKGEKKK